MTTLTPIETLFAAGTRLASEESAAQNIPRATKSLIIFLDLTDAQAAHGDTLDMYVQHSPDHGSSWDDIAHVAQIFGDGADSLHKLATIDCEAAVESELRAMVDKSLLAGSVLQGPIFPTIRAACVIAGATASFTFALTYQIIH